MAPSTSQRGSILMYTLLTMGVMLSIGITMTSVFIGRLQRARSIQDSTVALYAADSAVERCTYEARAVKNQSLTLTTSATFTITSGTVDKTSSCRTLGKTTFTFRAVGTYRNASRALEMTQ